MRSDGIQERHSAPASAFPRTHRTMEVFAVTIFMSLVFAVLFAVLFVAERSQRRRGCIEQDALLPLDEPAPPPSKTRQP